MTQEERRLFLLHALLAEEPRWQDIAIPADAQGQRDLLRSLMNVRPPKAIARRTGRLSAGRKPTQGNRRAVDAERATKRSVSVAGRHHPPGLRCHRQCGQRADAGLLRPLPWLHRQCDPHLCRHAAAPGLRRADAGPGSCRARWPGQTDIGLQSSQPIHPPHRRTAHHGTAHQTRPTASGCLLSFLLSTGTGTSAEEHRVLLHLHR